jgi:hypothetical protein
VREITDDEAGLVRTQIVQAFEHRLAIVERTEGIDHHDDVKRAGQGSQECRVLDVADEKRETGMDLARLADHAGAEIHAHAIRWFESGKHVAGAATEFEDAGSLRDKEFQVEQVLTVEKGAACEPPAALGRARVG